MAASDGAAECYYIKFKSVQIQFEPGDKSFLHANTSVENKLAKALNKCWTVPRHASKSKTEEQPKRKMKEVFKTQSFNDVFTNVGYQLKDI